MDNSICGLVGRSLSHRADFAAPLLSFEAFARPRIAGCAAVIAVGRALFAGACAGAVAMAAYYRILWLTK